MIDGDTAARIARDVGNGVAPKDSRLEYTEAMLKFRDEVQAEWDAFRETRTNAIMWAPE